MAHIMTYLLEDKPNDKPSQILLFYCNPGKQEPDFELWRAWDWSAIWPCWLCTFMALNPLEVQVLNENFKLVLCPSFGQKHTQQLVLLFWLTKGQGQGVKLGCWSRGIPELMITGQQWVGETELHRYGFMVTALHMFSGWLEERLRPITCTPDPLANPQHKSVLLWVLNRT